MTMNFHCVPCRFDYVSHYFSECLLLFIFYEGAAFAKALGVYEIFASYRQAV